MARRKKLNQYLEVSGPLFEDGLGPAVKGAISEAIVELGDEGAGILMGYIEAGGFRATGEFIRDVDAELRRDRAGSIGWVKIYPPHQYPEEGRPTRTWMEEGRRGNRLTGGERVRLTKGVGAFRKTSARLNAMKYDQFVLPRVLAVIDGD